MVLDTLDVIVMLCGITGALMVIGSMLLLYQGVIKLGEKSAGSALEAEFKNQLKVNIRNPALGLFVIGFSFFVLALYFTKPREGTPLIITAHLRAENSQESIDGVVVRLQAEETPITVSSEGDIQTTIQPLEKLQIVVQAPPGYRPQRSLEKIDSKKIKNGRVELTLKPFVRVPGDSNAPSNQDVLNARG